MTPMTGETKPREKKCIAMERRARGISRLTASATSSFTEDACISLGIENMVMTLFF